MKKIHKEVLNIAIGAFSYLLLYVGVSATFIHWSTWDIISTLAVWFIVIYILAVFWIVITAMYQFLNDSADSLNVLIDWIMPYIDRDKSAEWLIYRHSDKVLDD